VGLSGAARALHRARRVGSAQVAAPGSGRRERPGGRGVPARLPGAERVPAALLVVCAGRARLRCAGPAQAGHSGVGPAPWRAQPRCSSPSSPPALAALNAHSGHARGQSFTARPPDSRGCEVGVGSARALRRRPRWSARRGGAACALRRRSRSRLLLARLAPAPRAYAECGWRQSRAFRRPRCARQTRVRVRVQSAALGAGRERSC